MATVANRTEEETNNLLDAPSKDKGRRSGQKDIRRRMSEAHEAHLAEVLNGVRSRGSGNQAANPADGRQDHHLQSIAFSWDCKATVAKSISVKLSDWEKIKEQSEGERPLLPIRMYTNDRLTQYEDLVVLALDDLVELLDEIQNLFIKAEYLTQTYVECPYG